MKSFLPILFLFATTFVFSQSKSYTIEGTIKSKADAISLESATIHLEKVKDSSVVTYTITDEKGKFKLEGKSFEKELRLVVSFVGYKPYSQKIVFDKTSFQLGTIEMETNDNLLDEVIVKSRAPITIKKDTLEFNVKSFKTKKDASVEDLLKKLPGVEVDEEGKITVNGKPVNKILVNGKPFFGNDPTIATKNLTKEIIEKVQITDTKSKSEAFTGEKGDENNKTINLTINKENNKGWFGRLAAGAGTDERNEYAALVNRFNNDTRFSVLAGGNNINSPGFSFGEIQKMFGGGNSISVSSSGSFSIDGRSFGGGQGIVKSTNAGMTYADKLGKKIDLNGNYFFSGSNSANTSTRNRENILPTSRYFTNSVSKTNNDNKNHSIETEFDIEIDSTFLINITPTFTFNRREGFSANETETFDENQILTNSSTSNNSSSADAKNFQNDIDITKRFGKKGAFLKLGITNQIDKSDSEDFNISEIDIVNTSNERRNQFSDGKLDFTRFRTRLTYRQPLIAKKLFLDFTYTHEDSKRENRRSTYDFDTNTQQYSTFNTSLSTDFIYNDLRKTPSLSLSYRGKKWGLRFRSGYVFRTLESLDKLRPTLNIKRNFEAIELGSSFNYSLPSNAQIYMSYNLSNRSPQLSQLQPFVNVTNPLNIITGNPNLKPSNDHRINFNFNKFNFQKGTGFFVYAGINASNNQVISKSTIDPTTLVRNTTYENVNGNYDAYFSGSFNKSVKLDTVRSIKLRFGASTSFRKNINFFNDIKYSSKTTSLSPNIGFTFDWKNAFQIAPRYTISFSKSAYDLSTFNDQEFTRHTLNIRTKTLSKGKLEWVNDIQYNYNPNIVGDFQRSAWFWNTTLAYSVLKDKGTLSLKVYDLLNQNTNARRTATQNFIEDSENSILQQYVMLSFSWKFNSLGKKGETRDQVFFF
ncbi:MAG: outer membrane beta-barrel protein [Flavobacteriaceae bacterium]